MLSSGGPVVLPLTAHTRVVWFPGVNSTSDSSSRFPGPLPGLPCRSTACLFSFHLWCYPTSPLSSRSSRSIRLSTLHNVHSGLTAGVHIMTGTPSGSLPYSALFPIPRAISGYSMAVQRFAEASALPQAAAPDSSACANTHSSSPSTTSQLLSTVAPSNCFDPTVSSDQTIWPPPYHCPRETPRYRLVVPSQKV